MKQSRRDDQWVDEREDMAEKILKAQGTCLREFTGYSLLIHIFYGGQSPGGQSVIAKIDRVELRGNGLYFDFDYKRIKVSFDAIPNRKLGGAFKKLGVNEKIEIEGLSLQKDGRWIGIFWCNGVQAEMNEENLEVKFLYP